MSDRDGLLAAIRAAPDDDTPRLAFADWLDEAGSAAGGPWAVAPLARAALVRTQIAQSRADAFSPEWRAAAAEADRLLRPLKTEWTKPLARWVIGAEFCRGFPERVNVDAATLPAVADGLFATTPIRAVRLTRFRAAGGRVRLGPVFDLPHFATVAELDLSSQGLSDADLGRVFRGPHTRNLRALAVRQGKVTAKALADRLASPGLPHLDSLDLGDNPDLGRELPVALHAAGGRRFKSVNLSRIPLGHRDVATIAQAECLDGVEELRLAAPPNAPTDGPETADGLARSPRLRALRVLNLAGAMIGDAGVAALARSPHLTNLRVLNLSANGLNTPAVRAIVRHAAWDLYELNVSFNAVGHADRAALEARFPKAVVQG